MANIHAVRESFQKLVELVRPGSLGDDGEDKHWLSRLEVRLITICSHCNFFNCLPLIFFFWDFLPVPAPTLAAQGYGMAEAPDEDDQGGDGGGAAAGGGHLRACALLRRMGPHAAGTYQPILLL